MGLLNFRSYSLRKEHKTLEWWAKAACNASADVSTCPCTLLAEPPLRLCNSSQNQCALVRAVLSLDTTFRTLSLCVTAWSANCAFALRRILQQQNQHASGQMHTLPSMLTQSLRVLKAPPERHHWGPASSCSHEWSPQLLTLYHKPATVSLYSSRHSLWLMQAQHQEGNLRIYWQEHLLNQLCSVAVSFIT